MAVSRSLSSLILLALAFLSLSVSASPRSRTPSSTAPLKLAIIINSAGIKNVVAADQARAQALLQGSGSPSIDVTNSGMMYTAKVGVGSPPAYYTLLVDTGSSDSWIGASKPYVKTKTSQDTGNAFHIAYGGGTSTSGEEYLDTVTLSPDLVIEKQSIGVAVQTNASGGYLDGILGVGPVDLTKHTVSDGKEVPTVMDNLYAQRTISSEVLGVFFSPASAGDAVDARGEFTFGGYDASKIIGDISYVPITSTSPASNYWGVDQSISYGTTSILSKTAGIVDTGTTFLLIATDAFNRYKSETGASHDAATGLLKISLEQYKELSSLYFTIGGVTYELTPNAQIWPRLLNIVIGGTPDGIYLIVNDIGSNSGSGFDFVNGYCFLERFYSVYDTTNSRIGFAETAYTKAMSN
ncbi:acid protease [Suillus ampliporus]|nr:acid protease [Suillus ampliporus]